MVFLTWEDYCVEFFDLVTWDMVSGMETNRVRIDLSETDYVLDLDYDGTTTLLSQRLSNGDTYEWVTALEIEPMTAETTELPVVSRAAFSK